MNNKNNNNEDFEIVNFSSSGMLYSELKELHNISMITLNITSSSPIIPIILYSSRGVKISKTNNNWLILYHLYRAVIEL